MVLRISPSTSFSAWVTYFMFLQTQTLTYVWPVFSDHFNADLFSRSQWSLPLSLKMCPLYCNSECWIRETLALRYITSHHTKPCGSYKMICCLSQNSCIHLCTTPGSAVMCLIH